MPQNWQKAKNSIVKQRADAVAAVRFANADMRVSERNYEKIEDFLKRGGKIIRITPRETHEPIKEIVTMTPVKPKAKEPMTAINAAKMANDKADCTLSDILSVIPEYKAPLPRRSWIAKFKATLADPLDTRFVDLV